MGRKIGFAAAILCIIAAVAFMFMGDQIAGKGNTANTGNTTQLVTDSTGREVEVPMHPKRVVFLNASNMDLFVAAGGGDYVVGKPSSQALSDEVKAATANAPEVGVIHSPNIEKIISLSPDLVVGINVPMHQALIPTLEKAGIPMYIQSLDSFDQVYSTLEFYGKLTGHEQQTKDKIADMQKDCDSILKQIEGKQAPKSVVIFGSPQSFNMANKKTFTGELINRLHGVNIADNLESESAYIPLSMEFLTKENPDIIFLIMMGSGTIEEMQERIQNDLASNPAWQTTNAVRNNKVYILPYNLFTVNPGVQAVDAMKTLAGYMYDVK